MEKKMPKQIKEVVEAPAQKQQQEAHFETEPLIIQDPQIESARERQGASFELLAKVLSRAKKAGKEGALTPKMQEDCNEVFKYFEKAHGNIINLYICDDYETAVVLTQDSDGHWNYFSEYKLGRYPQLENLLIQVDRLAAETQRLLRGHELEQCTKMIYSVAKKTLRLIDGYAHASGQYGQGIIQKNDAIQETMQTVEHQLQAAGQYHRRAARLSAQFNYFTGTLVGLFALILVLFVFWIVVKHFMSADSQSIFSLQRHILGDIFVSGAVGAIISVLSRMNSDGMVLDHEASQRMLRLVGAARPIIGAVFAVVMLIFFKSTLLDSLIKLPSDIQSQNFFFMLIGFIAGFSERFAPDMLDLAGQKLAGKDVEPPPKGGEK